MTDHASPLHRLACANAGTPCPPSINVNRWLRVLTDNQQREVHKWYVALID